MDRKKIVALISALLCVYNPSSITIEKVEEEEDKPPSSSIKNNGIDIWAFSGRNFIMDKRWQIQFKLYK